MKKLALCIMTTCLLFAFHPQQSTAATVAVSSSVATTNGSAEARTLLLRLNEIKALDKSKLGASDKKSLRTEVLSIKERLQSLDGGGIYLSAGALIVIIVLLIILL